MISMPCCSPRRARLAELYRTAGRPVETEHEDRGHAGLIPRAFAELTLGLRVEIIDQVRAAKLAAQYFKTLVKFPTCIVARHVSLY